MDIDIVVLWVDGNDPAWRAEKSRYEGRSDDSGANRYRDWGLMKYWFRAIDAYAPWVRTIHFVTWGHLPPFLDTSNPRLHIVRHEEYMPPEALPTFNSCALEMNLHRIKGLAEHFIYFNDDVFLLRPMKPEQFFDPESGLPRAQFCEFPCRFQGELESYSVHLARDVGLINKHFSKRAIPWRRFFGLYLSRRYPFVDKLRTLTQRVLYTGFFTGFRVFHSYFCYNKSTFETVWREEGDMLMRTTLSRFRGWENVNQYILYMWQLASGTFSPTRMHFLHASMTPELVDEVCGAIRAQRYDSICVNDPSTEVDYEQMAARLGAAFEQILPEKCSFEK